MLAQSTEKIFLEFHQRQKYSITLPCCIDISTRIDTMYKKQDTLFIEIIDDRNFRLDSNANHKTLYITGHFYGIKSKKIRIPLKIPISERECHFIALQVYDNIFVFKRNKNLYVLLDTRIFREYSYLCLIESNSPLRECPAYNAKKRKK